MFFREKKYIFRSIRNTVFLSVCNMGIDYFESILDDKDPI